MKSIHTASPTCMIDEAGWLIGCHEDEQGKTTWGGDIPVAAEKANQSDCQRRQECRTPHASADPIG